MKFNRCVILGIAIYFFIITICINYVRADEKNRDINSSNINNPIYNTQKKMRSSTFFEGAADIKNLPRDRFGLIDWVQMVKKELISTRSSVDPDHIEESQPMDLNILFEMKGKLTDNVIFPHLPHTYWFDCINCHDEIFVPLAGGNKVTMAEIVKGAWCGRCHGKVSFPLSDCQRCHRYPKGHEIEKAETTTRRVVKR